MPFSPHLAHIAGVDQSVQLPSVRVLEHTHSHCISEDIPIGWFVHPSGTYPVWDELVGAAGVCKLVAVNLKINSMEVPSVPFFPFSPVSLIGVPQEGLLVASIENVPQDIHIIPDVGSVLDHPEGAVNSSVSKLK